MLEEELNHGGYIGPENSLGEISLVRATPKNELLQNNVLILTLLHLTNPF